VLSLPPSVRIFVATQPVDGRKGVDSLAAIVRSALSQDPLSGHLLLPLRLADVIGIWPGDAHHEMSGRCIPAGWASVSERGRATEDGHLRERARRAQPERCP
jgi:hypothetical protein